MRTSGAALTWGRNSTESASHSRKSCRPRRLSLEHAVARAFGVFLGDGGAPVRGYAHHVAVEGLTPDEAIEAGGSAIGAAAGKARRGEGVFLRRQRPGFRDDADNRL